MKIWYCKIGEVDEHLRAALVAAEAENARLEALIEEHHRVFIGNRCSVCARAALAPSATGGDS